MPDRKERLTRLLVTPVIGEMLSNLLTSELANLHLGDRLLSDSKSRPVKYVLQVEKLRSPRMEESAYLDLAPFKRIPNALFYGVITSDPD